MKSSAKIEIHKILEINGTSSIASIYTFFFSIHPHSPITPESINSLHMTQCRPNVFNNGHKLQFDLSVATGTPTDKTNSVTCLFCDVFGREKSGCVVKKQRELSTIQSFKPPFRSDNIHSHLKNQHAMMWEQHEKLCAEEKLSSFDLEVPYINTITSHFGASNELQYLIHAPIVEKEINRFSSYTNKNITSNLSQRNDLSTLSTRESDDYFVLSIAKKCHYEMVVRNVALSMSFRQVAKSVHVARSVNQLLYLSDLWEGEMRLYVQVITASISQHIRVLMSEKSCWSYSIAMDSTTNRGDSFVDVRVRIFVDSKIEKVHLLAISMTEFHTGTVMF